jgi:hypothetical protein
MTVHMIDEHLAECIEQAARERGESLNSTIKGLLTQALGLNSEGLGDLKNRMAIGVFLAACPKPMFAISMPHPPTSSGSMKATGRDLSQF